MGKNFFRIVEGISGLNNVLLVQWGSCSCGSSWWSFMPMSPSVFTPDSVAWIKVYALVVTQALTISRV